MTRPLRRAHFWVWIALAIALPALLLASLAVRRTGSLLNPGMDWKKSK